MEKIIFKTAKDGFYYKIHTMKPSNFIFRFFVIGVAGKFKSGEILSRTTENKDWIFNYIGFPVMHVGLTSFEIVSAADLINEDDRIIDNERPEDKKYPSFSRREMLKKAAAATFMIVGANFLPPLFQNDHLYGQSKGNYDPYNMYTGSYEPYATR
jgi:hypothetical protein